METKGEEIYLRHIRNLLALFLVILLMGILKVTSSVILPFVVALFLFVFVNPLLNRLDRTRIPKTVSTCLVLVLVVLVSALFLYVIFVVVNMLLSKLPYYATRVNEIDRLISYHIAPLFDAEEETFSIISFLDINWYSIAISSLSSFSSKLLGIFSDAMLTFVYLLFMLLERQSFVPKLMAITPKEKADRIARLSMRINRQISKYIFLKLVISVLTGILFYLVAIITGLDFALAWGLLATVLNFIPTIGSIIVTAGTIIMAFIQFAPSWLTILYISVLMISIEMIVGNIIDPRLQGVQLNISPLVILVSLAIWGYIWGLPGMFLAVPLTSTLQIFMANIPSLKSVAIILSTGKVQRDEEKKRKRRKEKNNEQKDDFEMPEGRNPN